MKTLRTLLAGVALFSVATVMNAQMHTGAQITTPNQGQTPWYANAGLAYGFDIEEFGLSLGGGYELPQVDGLRIGTEFIWYFMDDGGFRAASTDVDFWTWSAFAQYSFYQDQDWDVYALGGLMYSRLSLDFNDPVLGIRGSSSDSDLGLLLGVGAEYKVMDQGSIYADFKYNTGTYDQGVLSGGFRYFF